MLKYYFICSIIACSVLLMHFTACKSDEQKQSSTLRNKPGNIIELEKTIPLEGVKGRIDHLSIDVKNQLLFIAALGNNSVEIVDLNKAEEINSINGIGEPQGVIYISDNNSVCITGGASGNVYFYDAKTLNLEKSFNLGVDADNIRYDSSSKLIFAGFGDGNIAVIDGLKQSLITSINFTGHPEAFQLEKNKNRLYVNVPETNSIEIIDYKTDSVMVNRKINTASNNFPMAIDDSDHVLFIGCRKPPKLIVFDTDLQKEIEDFVIKEDVDDIFYDPERKLIYLSCGEGYLQIFKYDRNDGLKLIEEIKTSKRTRTSLFVPELNRIFAASPEANGKSASILVYRLLN